MPIKHIAIAGCGVAGLALGAMLARRGLRVTVFDRLASPQPLGSGLILQPVGIAVLDELGVGARIRELGAPIRRLFGRSEPSGRVVLDVRYDALGDADAHGIAVHRGALFQVLYDAALAAGVEIIANHEVIGADYGRFAFADGSQSARFDQLIDALGMRSVLSRAPEAPLPFGALWASLDWAEGFDAEALEQRYVAARKMVGVLPIGRLAGATQKQAAFFWSLKHTDHAAWRAAPIGAWKDEVRALWPETAPLLDQITDHDDLVFAAYAHRTLASPLGADCVHVGDSWHCTSPQLGQGANMALLDAYALDCALRSQSDLALALGEYERLRIWHIRLYQAASWMFTPAYQSDSAALAWVRDRLMAPLSRTWPAPKILAGLVAGQIGAPLQTIARVLRNTEGAGIVSRRGVG